MRDAVEAALAGLDDADRVAERDAGGTWQVNQWLKAVLLSFNLNDMEIIEGGAGGLTSR